MTAIERIRDILEADGYAPTLAAVEGKDVSQCPLIVPFRPDELGRELVLFIEVMPREGDDEVSLINFSVIYPFEIEETDQTEELVRVLFLLNRYLPIGSHGLCEQTPAVYYSYQLVAADAEFAASAVVKETVNLIGYFTRQHSRYIGLILSGDGSCDELLDELELTGNSMPPLFARVLSESAADETVPQ